MFRWRVREPASLDFAADCLTVLPSILRSHIEDLGFRPEELVEMSRVGGDLFGRFYGPLDDDRPARPRLRIVNWYDPPDRAVDARAPAHLRRL